MEGDCSPFTLPPFWIYFNPLPPHGGRPSPFGSPLFLIYISIHSLRMEGDIFRLADLNVEIISIHSLRMEGDLTRAARLSAYSHFNPLPPHGGRLVLFHFLYLVFSFQSTPSAWRETVTFPSPTWEASFQSTPSAWRETDTVHFNLPIRRNFNPLPPHGGRLQFWGNLRFQIVISIHSLRMEGDPWDVAWDALKLIISIHSLRMEGDFHNLL